MFGSLLLAGCGQVWNGAAEQASVDGVRLLVLTTLGPDAAGGGMQLRAYVQFEEGVEAARLRFELYEFMPLDANPRGKRVMLWPAVESGPKDSYWRPHLGAYEFVLPVEAKIDIEKTYLAEVSVLSEEGRRRGDTIRLKPKQQ